MLSSRTALTAEVGSTQDRQAILQWESIDNPLYLLNRETLTVSPLPIEACPLCSANTAASIDSPVTCPLNWMPLCRTIS